MNTNAITPEARRESISCGDVIRYRPGKTAIMRVDAMDDLCGYRTYHGVHLYGENVSMPKNEHCRRANKEEFRLWCSYKVGRGVFE